MGSLASKGHVNTLICICGMDGKNAISREGKGLERRIRHTAPHSIYINCNNHRLALCLKHMIPRYQIIVKLGGMRLSIWKLLHYSSIKQTIFEQVQAMAEVQPIKIIKACTTRGLTHGEAISRVISRFETILGALDTIAYEKGEKVVLKQKVLETNT